MKYRLGALLGGFYQSVVSGKLSFTESVLILFSCLINRYIYPAHFV
ncbi:hypothetical protein [Celerinatantimonas diazotrophica]|nr:hypothetical protein [Celerinatantimonas diazotrophica]